jgi:hypothetical protein
MNHFLKRNFSSIVGAGGQPEKGDPPPPPVLNPPKLGALTALTSYSYSESVDALSEGPIEGIVNQNGQYINGYRIFEGIYIDDVPIKKTCDPMDSTITRSTAYLGDIIQDLTSNWFNGDSFEDFSLNNLPLVKTSYDPVLNVNNPYESFKVSNDRLSAEIVYGKKNIAKAIFLGFNTLRHFSDSLETTPDLATIAKQKLLRYDAFSSLSIIENELLRDYPLSTDFPFFCVKINLGSMHKSNEPRQLISDLPIGRNVDFYIEDDIANQVFQPLEISEIGKTRVLRPLGTIDTSFLYSDVESLTLGGYIYLFGVHQNGFPTKETLITLRENVKNIHVLDFNQAKYNYSNVLAEIRSGEELQSPLGFFDKTYLDKTYGIKLLGPFSNQGNALRVTDFKKGIETGVIKNLLERSTGSTGFSTEELINEVDRKKLETVWGLEGWLTKDGENYDEVLTGLVYFSNVTRTLTLKTPDDFSATLRYDVSTVLYYVVVITQKVDKFSYNMDYFKYEKVPYYETEIRVERRWVDVCREVSVYGGEPYNYCTRETVEVEVEVQVLKYRNEWIKYDFPLSTRNSRRLLAVSVVLLATIEGSQDSRAGKSFSAWSESSMSQFDEEPNSVIHVVRNPNVSNVFITMGIRALSDTAEKTKTLAGTKQEVDIGAKIPSTVRFKIEIGLQDASGIEQPPSKSIVYQVIGLAETPALIDIGRAENANNVSNYARFIQGSENIAYPLTLPKSVDGTFRYVKVTRTTYESYSSLIRREISLEKVTEIIDSKFSYPNTAIVGVKLDARTLSSMPPRSYDARLKRIMVPTNYYPLYADGRDKRFYKTISEFSNAPKANKLIYNGDWDGTFKEVWSDNPAWIVFDLLTNARYGMGNYVSADQINIWELYKIGRFCDAVDEDGYFYGVPSSNGGLEPRYSCNIIIADKTNIFDAIKNLVSSFRGNIFYSNSYIDFTDDRVKLPNYFFNNQNVRDGLFNYTNSRRDQQYNTLEINYFDRDDNFKVKTEYVEDPEDIKKRGVLRADIDTFGVTSRAHANRIGKHIIYSTVNENQAVSFACGPEVLACRPGDLISIEDDLKSLQKNIGRVLEIDTAQKILRLDEQFKSDDYLNEVSLFIPTGQKTYSDYYNMAVSPSKLAMNELYANDVPQIATFKTTGYKNLDYGCYLYLNPEGENIALLDKAKAGGIYSITLSGLKQEIYKLTSVKENSPIEYEVAAIKFDTGKFGSIENSQSLVDFYNNYPNVSAPTQGSETISQNNLYQLSYPVIQSFSTGNYDQQADSIDLSGSWTAVNGATHYDYELITPKYSFLNGRTTGLSAVFTDQTQAGRFTLKVSARNISSVPNPISATYSSGITVLSYSAPIRTNSVFAGISIKNS